MASNQLKLVAPWKDRNRLLAVQMQRDALKQHVRFLKQIGNRQFDGRFLLQKKEQ